MFTKPTQPAASKVIAPTTITFPGAGLINCEWVFDNDACVVATFQGLEGPWDTTITLGSGQIIHPGPLPYTYQLQAWVQWVSLLPPTRHSLAETALS